MVVHHISYEGRGVTIFRDAENKASGVGGGAAG